MASRSKRGGSHYQTADLPELPELPRAVCRGMPVEMFIGTDGEHHEVRFNPKPAFKVCWTCPERRPCLEYALATPSLMGVWGATMPEDRKAMRADKAVS